MSQRVAAEPVPLTVDSDQVMRIAGTRVELETVVLAFDAGATPEEIAQDYPVLDLEDVYAVITYYLRHREEVRAYVERRRAASEALREKVHARLQPTGLRDRLLTRLESQERNRKATPEEERHWAREGEQRLATFDWRSAKSHHDAWKLSGRQS